jgi:hypothetical protein
MTKEATRPSVRITNQFRKRDAMVYDLSCEDVRLTIEVAQRQNDDGQGEWVVEAHARHVVEKPTINEPGATRSDALQAVARSWTAKNGAYGFPRLDWEAVSAAMLVVRAI